jgi:hypothetical protein
MKKIALATLLTASTTLLMAQETKFLPIATENNYSLSPSVALVGGYGKYDELDSGSALYGIELDIACPLLQLSSNKIKQQISVVHYSEKDKFNSTSIELNPHVMFDVANKLQVGVGPGFGVVFADADGDTDTVFGINIGASANYDITSKMFVGAEARYQWTTDADFGGGDVSLDNYRTLLKVGYHF